MKTDPKKAQSQLGKAIQTQRKQRGYSQEAFALLCGVHRTYMGGIERGERNVSLANIVKISDALNMTASELFALANF